MGSTTHCEDKLAVEKKVLVRGYAASDLRQVQELERKCEVGGGSSGVSLHADLMGDPLCRVRHFAVYEMLVAVLEDEIVGVVRAGVKEVVCGREKHKGGSSPIFAKIGYLLGLRVSPTHRRMRIGMRLAMKMEDWCNEQGAEYVYVATVKDNEASVKLFNGRLQYIPLRTPVILVQPVFVYPRPIPAGVQLSKLSSSSATVLYRSALGNQEFFPKDIDVVLGSKLCAGTWVATLKEDELQGLGSICKEEESWLLGGGRSVRPRSWAVLSVWKCNEIYTLELRGVSLPLRTLAAASRLVEWALPGCALPSFPNLFAPFGMHCIFGLHAEGPKGAHLLSALCRHAHNVALRNACSVVMAEVGVQDPLKDAIPHWKFLSSADDLWSVKRLQKSPPDLKLAVEAVTVAPHSGDKCDEPALKALTDRPLAMAALEPHPSSERLDWCSSPASATLFVDPRDV